MAEIYEQYLPPIGGALRLRDTDRQFFRQTVAPAPSPTANLHFAICRVDGFPTLLTSSDPPGTGETTAEIGPLCPRCQNIQNNNPAIFNHVVRMINASRWLWTSVVP